MEKRDVFEDTLDQSVRQVQLQFSMESISLIEWIVFQCCTELFSRIMSCLSTRRWNYIGVRRLAQYSELVTYRFE